jgi:hypothetical protein
LLAGLQVGGLVVSWIGGFRFADWQIRGFTDWQIYRLASSQIGGFADSWIGGLADGQTQNLAELEQQIVISQYGLALFNSLLCNFLQSHEQIEKWAKI